MIRLQDSIAGHVCASRRVVMCDACGKEIRQRQEVRILRATDAIPEDPTIFEVHEVCVEPFIESHDDETWHEVEPNSPDAAWFMPVVIRKPERRLRLPGRSGTFPSVHPAS
jgi:hypothetical protein